MDKKEALAFLAEGTRTGKLATASPSGDAHVAPIWFLVDGGDLVFSTGRDTVKGRNLRAHGQAALAADIEVFPYSFVTVRGPVSIQENAPDLLAWSTRLAERYVPAGQAAKYGERNAVEGELLCRLHVEAVSGARDLAA
jgi:PPOX class probable F420-dependent enzyme